MSTKGNLGFEVDLQAKSLGRNVNKDAYSLIYYSRDLNLKSLVYNLQLKKNIPIGGNSRWENQCCTFRLC